MSKISDDGGRSFGPLRVIVPGRQNTAGNQCPVYDAVTGKVVLLFNRNDADGPEHMILQGKARRTVHITESADQGETWAPEREITAQTKLPQWTWHAMGPCHAVQTADGRLVVPCNHAVLNEEEGVSGPYCSHTLYSDDHGVSWHIGEDIREYTNECSLALRSDGTLLMSMRRFGEYACRALAVSKDGGATFEDFRWEQTLPDPCCQGSVLEVNVGGKHVILFSNPATTNVRNHLVIHESADDGCTWSEGCVITEAPAAYSDLTVICDGHIGVLYETGTEGPYERIEWTVYHIAL